MSNSFLNQYPEILAALVAVLGVVAAGFVARWFEKVLGLVEGLIRRVSPLRADQLSNSTPRVVISRVVYYATSIFFLLLAIRILGIFAITEWLDVFLNYIPQILLGGFIITAGYVLGLLVYSVVSNLLNTEQSKLLPRLAQCVVVVTAVMTGLEQMHIDVSFVTYVIAIVLATSLGGLSIAFALGSKAFVSNLVARRGIGHLCVGDTIVIDGSRGVIVELTSTAVAIESDVGVTHIPATRFLEVPVTVVGS